MKRVLIVEDQKEVRELLEEVFMKELGFKYVTFASDGLEGFAESYLQEFDLICTDHGMPFFNGGDLIAAIRSKPGINQHTPIIMISALIPELPVKLKGMENTYFVEKPIDYGRLRRYVKMAIATSKNRFNLMPA